MIKEAKMNYQAQYKKWQTYANLDNDIKEELTRMDESTIEDAFYKDLEFGTGGIRGVVGAGTNRMNIYTIRKANTGFAHFLLNRFHDVIHRGVVIAHDNRHFSKTFALESAKVMASHGIKAYLFDALRPTPELSFAVRHLNAIGGIMITASHNPPQYNGYKIYDESGCQLIPEFADQVIDYVDAIEDIFSLKVEDETTLREKGLIVTIGQEIDKAYINLVKAIQLNPNLAKNNLKIVFSPLHGAASVIAPQVFSESGYKNVFFVDEQMENDPDFSTVQSPNPEDHEAFTLAIDLGKKLQADILITTDPDADRLGVAVYHKGNYVLLTGNQTGAILINYILSQLRIQNRLPKEGVVFNTIVTSELGAEIARHFGMDVESTLTGFKFIGDKIKGLEQTNREFVFGYEESYGYLIADFVRDKDSIQALLILSEAASYYKHFDKTLVDALNELYAEYGYYQESLANITLEGKAGEERIQTIMNFFRNQAPVEVAGLAIKFTEDYLHRIRKDETSEETLHLPTSNVLKFILADGSWFVLRPSGTEPKLKVYVGVVDDELKKSVNKNQKIKQAILDVIDSID